MIFYTYTVITVWFTIETNLLQWQSAMILSMILFTHAMIIIWFSIEREVKWPHSSSAAFTTSSSIAGDDDAIMGQALASHADLSNPTRAALETILAERNNLSSQNPQLPQKTATQLLPCVKRCQKIEGRAWSITGEAWDTHKGEGNLRWQEPKCAHAHAEWALGVV